MAYLGIDVGSLFVGLVLVDEQGAIQQREYLRHQGEPLKCVRGLLARLPLDTLRGMARTGAGSRNLPLPGPCLDPIVAGVEGARRLAPDARNILSIGGGSFSLTQLDESGHYRRSSINSACASGTGAFLDQQAVRLQIPPSELAQRAMRYDGRPPGVATRCAVFAKSDMIHLQQEGFSVEAIAAGLCTGLGAATVDGLLEGRALAGKTVLIGGMARNSVVVNAIREKLGVETVVPDHAELTGAYGAALVALQHGETPAIASELRTLLDRAEEDASGAVAADTLRPPLELRLSRYPGFRWQDHWINGDNSEVAIATPRSGAVKVALGIDIGSTSTKATALDEENQVVGWVYRKTAGNPIRAVQLVFSAFREMEQRGGFTLDIRGVGTTGSGRKMIKEVIGADLAMNEITAHASAAVFIDPQVDTIIELGGQDAKFTQLQNGMVYNSVMNYVCAAGTGSFIEEQSHKLGIPLEEFADRAMGKPCPRTSDRCTVYMERDLDLLLARGWSKDQVAAAVLHSVRDNYLNKVVGGLHIGDHIYFQGATARNRALVAAFESELQKPIAVSPFCHLTGSLGMSLLVRERVSPEQRSARFKGLAFADETVTVDREVCELCHNLCNLSIIRAGSDVVAWGLKCGRDYGEKRRKVRKVNTYDAWKQRNAAWAAEPARQPPSPAKRPRVGLPRSLGTYGYAPFWRAFLSELGAEVVQSPPSGEKILQRGGELTTAEYCAPVVMSHGHARALLEDAKVDYLFVPHMLREPAVKGFSNAHFCCYVQAHPGVLRSVEGLQLNGRLLAPVVDLSRPEATLVQELQTALGGALGAREDSLRRALKVGRAAQSAFQADCLRLGREVMARLESQNELGIVCFGRPYNTTDPGLTLDLPRKMAELGYHVLYLDMLPYDLQSILPGYSNMYWHYGQKILAAAQFVAASPRLFGVYFTNFMCGPDSYVLTYFKDIMGRAGKPYLCLQFDGHGADAGYLTRVEAALESFHAWSGIPRPAEMPAEAED